MKPKTFSSKTKTGHENEFELEVLDDPALVQGVSDGVEEVQLLLRLQRVELERQKETRN